jgi:hypothetical protein
MGGGGTTNFNDNVIGQNGDPGATTIGAMCSSAFHIANKQNITTYPFPSVTHLGIQSTKIIPTVGQFLGKW